MQTFFVFLLPDGCAKFSDFAFELVNDQSQRLLGLVPAYLRPRRLDVRDSPVVNCADVHAQKVDPHFTVHVVALNLLGWAVAKNLAAQVHHLFDKLRPKLVDLHFFEFLQLVLIDQWTNEGVAVPSGEVLDKALANLRLLVFGVRTLLLQSVLQIIALTNFVSFFVF